MTLRPTRPATGKAFLGFALVAAIFSIACGPDKGAIERVPTTRAALDTFESSVSVVFEKRCGSLDCHGNIYVTEHTAARARVFSPAGKQLATIKFDANVTNVAFGGAE